MHWIKTTENPLQRQCHKILHNESYEDSGSTQILVVLKSLIILLQTK